MRVRVSGLNDAELAPVLSAQAAASGTLSGDFDSLPLGQIAETGDLKLLSTGGSDKTQAVESEGILMMSSLGTGPCRVYLKKRAVPAVGIDYGFPVQRYEPYDAWI